MVDLTASPEPAAQQQPPAKRQRVAPLTADEVAAAFQDADAEEMAGALPDLEACEEMEAKLQEMVEAVAERKLVLNSIAKIQDLDVLDEVVLTKSTDEDDQDVNNNMNARCLSASFLVGPGKLPLSLRIDVVDEEGDVTVNAECDLWQMHDGRVSKADVSQRSEWTDALFASGLVYGDCTTELPEGTVDCFVYGVTQAMLDHLADKHPWQSQLGVGIEVDADDVAQQLGLVGHQ